jgi:hypothetical protein
MQRKAEAQTGGQSFDVAARQLNHGSCVGTTYFDLRGAQRGFSSEYRAGVHFITINFRTRWSRSARMPAAFSWVRRAVRILFAAPPRDGRPSAFMKVIPGDFSDDFQAGDRSSYFNPASHEPADREGI